MIEKRGRGRPKAGDEKKTKMMCFWVSEKTREDILKACKLENVLPAQFCEEAAMKKLRRILKE